MCPFSIAIVFVFAAHFGLALREEKCAALQVSTLGGCERASNKSLTIPKDQVEIVFVRHGVSLNNVFKKNMFQNLKGMAKLKMSKSYTWKSSSSSDFKAGYATVCNGEHLCGPYKNGSSDLRWEIYHQSQDCLLHPLGEAEAIAKGNLLKIVLPGDSISGFFTSPLRRTIQTLFSGFRSFIDPAPVQVMPWLHERFKSRSDWAYPGGITVGFLAAYQKKSNVSAAIIANMTEQLHTLGDWTVKRGKITGFATPKLAETLPVCDIPGVTASQAHLLTGETESISDLGDINIGDDNDGDDNDELTAEDEKVVAEKVVTADEVECGGHGNKSMAYYPGKWQKDSPGKESEESLKTRMDIVRRWLKTLEKGKRYVMVSHGGVGSSLLGSYAKGGLKGKLANFGVITGRFNPDKADPLSPGTFFVDVQTGAERWGCKELPGWRG